MITVNGESVQDAEGKSVAEFLESHGYPKMMVAVEVDGRIVPRAAWGETVLKEGAVVEVVRFVGGG